MIDDERANALFRIAEKFLTKVIRHALALEVQLTISVREETVVLDMNDNGIGISPQRIDSPNTLRIRGMKERTMILGGQFNIVGKPGEGPHVKGSSVIGKRYERTFVKILVADDHDIVRLSLQKLLSQAFPNLDLEDVATGGEAVEKVKERAWDTVILDLNLPDLHGLDVLKRIKIVRPTLPVIILSLYPVEQFAMRAYKGGASAYLTKDAVGEELITAIKQVVDGRTYFSQAFSKHLADQLEKPGEGAT